MDALLDGSKGVCLETDAEKTNTDSCLVKSMQDIIVTITDKSLEIWDVRIQ
jgi:hypothetical protein